MSAPKTVLLLADHAPAAPTSNASVTAPRLLGHLLDARAEVR